MTELFFAPFRQSVKVLLCSYHQLWSDTVGFPFWFHHLLIWQFAKKDNLLNAKLLLEPLQKIRVTFSCIFPNKPATRGWYCWQCTKPRLQLIFPQLCHLCSTCPIKIKFTATPSLGQSAGEASAVFRQLNTKPGQGKSCRSGWASAYCTGRESIKF